MNASVFRTTRFEIGMIHQGPNSFGIAAAERGVHGSQVERLEVPEEDFTDEEMAQVHAVLEMLEEKFAAVFDRKTRDLTPAVVHDMLNTTERAKAAALAAQKAAAKADADRVQLEEAASRAAADCAATMVEKERLAAELAALDAAIAAKRAEAAKA